MNMCKTKKKIPGTRGFYSRSDKKLRVWKKIDSRSEDCYRIVCLIALSLNQHHQLIMYLTCMDIV